MDGLLAIRFNTSAPEPIPLGGALSEAIAGAPGWSARPSEWDGHGPGYFSVVVLWRHANPSGVLLHDLGSLRVQGNGPGAEGSAQLSGTFLAPIVDEAHRANADEFVQAYARAQIDGLERRMESVLPGLLEQNLTVSLGTTVCYPPPPVA